MQLKVASSAPAARPDQLTALIDLRPAENLFKESTAREHPAWTDLERHRAQGELKSEYLAIGESPLLYLPAAAARYWTGHEQVRILAARAWEAAVARGAAQLVVLLDGPGGSQAAPMAAEGILLQAYRFTRYKAQAEAARRPDVTLVAPGAGINETRARVDRSVKLVEACNRARDLVNEPGSVATPAEIEARARKVAKSAGLKLVVLQKSQLEKEGYNGLLTVGRGSEVPPRMIVLRYVPPREVGERRPNIHLGLLGKGITFDTGGISIKPADKMWQMKGDMSGAAAVLYAMEAIATLQLPIRVTAVICTSQNYVDACSVVPGDIFTARNGKTVMVDNTDAEGRLVLTDGLYRLGEEQVTHLVDVATLTGACMRALGNAVSGAFGNDDFCDFVVDVAGSQGEPCWRLPIIEEYRPWLDTEIANLNNMSSVPLLAGATVAALFLREFVPSGVHWTHLDIAGTFFKDKQEKYYRTGATGIMTRTLAVLADRLSAN